MDGPALTIGCVSYKSASYVALNQRLTQFLNPDAPVHWIVVTNDTKKPARVAPQLAPETLLLGRTAADRSLDFPKGRHHAAGLHQIIERVATRFLLVLDPDFFIVRRNWVADCLAHMDAHGLSFFGAAHHPRRASKFRYFPSVMCTFIDLSRVNRRDLDFNPGTYHTITAAGRRERRARRQGSHRLPTALTRIARQVGHFVGRPGYVGKVQDTGYRIHERFSADPSHKSDCVTPVLRPEVEWPEAFASRSPLALIRRLYLSPPLLPESFSILPGRRGYTTHEGFRECGVPAVTDHAWEEHVWRGTPFGFHVTRHSRFHSMDLTIDFKDVERAAAEVTGMPAAIR
jgi:hypothetical protein